MSTGRAARLRTYLSQAFPVAVLVPSAFVNVAAIHMTLHALAFPGPARIGWRFVPGSLSIALFMLLLRVFDELKDAESDRALARAGDARFAGRVVVTGAVHESDLAFLARWVGALLVLLNVPMGFPLPLGAFAITFVVVIASRHWFFWPSVKSHLVLAFLTHNPISLLLNGYVAAIFWREHRRITIEAIPLLAGLWLSVAAWETARKIRTPAEETDYQTYSKVLGLRTAIATPGFLVAASTACLLFVARAARLGAWAAVPLATSSALVAFACVRALASPTPSRVRLRPFAELHGAVANLALGIAVAATHGVALA
ncbi:MAG: hypothetical protein U0166_21860 [Acidobacteriota bacterium]